MTQSTVVGVFEDRAAAERAVEELHRAGFREDQIGFAARDGEAPRGSGNIEEDGSEAGAGAAKGLLGGGIIGGILGALATGLIPGVGPVIAGGLLAGLLGGAAVGAATGGLLGALVGGMGVPEDEARYYDQEFRAGRTIVTVGADGRYAEAQAILRRGGAYDVESRDNRAPETDRGRETDGRETLQLREEQLETRKQTVETGQVTLGKEVVEREKTLQVPVSHEEVYVQRRVVDRPADRPLDQSSPTIEVPVHAERVDVSKQAVVYEEVGVNKQQVVTTQPVSETVRREELRVGKEGDVKLSGDSPDARESAR